MQKEVYTSAGYRLSLQIEQAEIDRAEKAVKSAYLDAIASGIDESTEEYKNALLSLSFLYLLQHSIYATRAGAKGVQIQSATTSTNLDVLRECVFDAHNALQALRDKVSNQDAKVNDICRIYFSTNYFKLL